MNLFIPSPRPSNFLFLTGSFDGSIRLYLSRKQKSFKMLVTKKVAVIKLEIFSSEYLQEA